MTKRITITLPDELVSELDALAAPAGLSRSGVIREASARYVADAGAAGELERRRTGTDALLAYLDELRTHPVLDDRPVAELLHETRYGAGDEEGCG
jgi:metal-responsive CopG/Arc/MetJ family transcriptional regulator